MTIVYLLLWIGSLYVMGRVAYLRGNEDGYAEGVESMKSGS